ncbi:MAG TPA: glycosyltransferase family 9 protein, partial [Rhabdochlamydiaceae bacterium]|nr:glycosyltransferase family 9 protein [Rhabdochlamydiaceae bacterium]
IATPNCDYPYWEQGRFNGRLSFADNLYFFCRNQLNFTNATKENGIKAPPSVVNRKYLSRVVIHPTSSRAGKNWSKEKYIKLAQELKKMNFDPVFVLGEDEKEGWENEKFRSFSSFDELAVFVAESGVMIGNDSGIGHLASCLGLPTLTICRSKMAADFWRPGWSHGEIVVPPSWIPNLKGLRWRDQHWQKFVSLGKVLSKFREINHRGTESTE